MIYILFNHARSPCSATVTLLLSLGIILGPAASCSIDDEDRCAGDLVWISKYRACGCPKGTKWTGRGPVCETVPEQSSNQPVADDSGTSDADTDRELGIGEPCQNEDDCSHFQATICVPMPTGGYCSLECQSPNDCIEGFKCCDCTESTVVPPGTACTKEADVTMAEDLGGCRCE